MTDEAYDAREHYTKYEFRVPMRDGVGLFTSVLVPKDASTAYPFLIVRSPFGVNPYGPDEYPPSSSQTEALLKAGYIWVRQDVHGRRMAGGEFTHMTPHRPEKTASDVDESTDLCDTVDWLLRHVPNHNGRVGIYGGSYAGFYTVAGIIDTQPAIRQVQSSWFSLVDRNPQTFVTIPTARPEDFKVATECVVRSQAQPSGVEVYVLPAL